MKHKICSHGFHNLALNNFEHFLFCLLQHSTHTAFSQILQHIKLTLPSISEFPLPRVKFSPEFCMLGLFLSCTLYLKNYLFREVFFEHPISSLVLSYHFIPFYFLHSSDYYLIFSSFSFIQCLSQLECMYPQSAYPSLSFLFKMLTPAPKRMSSTSPQQML